MKPAMHHSHFFLWLKKISLTAFFSALIICATYAYAAVKTTSDSSQSSTNSLLIYTPITNTSITDSEFKSLDEKDFIYLAVAANFKSTLQQLVNAFALEYPNIEKEQLKIISGATGALYAQIIQGAPFDIFFAADTKRPQLLIKKNHAKKNSYYNYAYGQLAFAFQAREKELCKNGIDSQNVLIEFINSYQPSSKPTLAIANPAIAPYGLSANRLIKQSEKAFSQYRIVKGKNVLHAQQLLLNNNADLAILSAAQSTHAAMENYDFCLINKSLYTPIEQAMVIIKQAQRTDTQEYLLGQFFDFIKQESAQSIILSNGYLINE